MFLDKKRLQYIFLTALILTLFFPIFFAGFPIFFLAPVIVISIYQRSAIGACWIALACGLVQDLLYSPDRFGPYTLSLVISTAVLYPQRRHFFADNLTTLPIMTYLLSALAALLQIGYVMVMEKTFFFSVQWLIADVFILPLVDSIAAFGLFIAPFLLFGARPRKGEDYFTE